VYKLTGVTKLYQKGRRIVPAVRDLDLVIEDGAWLAVQGRTGSGKSTLLNLLGGLDRPTEGTVELDGADLSALREHQLTRLRATSIGFVFQTFNLVPTLSVAENVEAALIPLGAGHSGRRQRVAAALESVGLADRASHLPSELSGGQQQRVAIARARALVKDPKVLLADEPTGNLDEDTRDDIIALLERLWHDRGRTLVLITHDTSIARRAQSAGLMNKGRLAIRQAAAPRGFTRRLQLSFGGRQTGAETIMNDVPDIRDARVAGPHQAGRCDRAGPRGRGGTADHSIGRIRRGGERLRRGLERTVPAA
jgi:putative ABC transport system ATP-binding protein